MVRRMTISRPMMRRVPNGDLQIRITGTAGSLISVVTGEDEVEATLTFWSCGRRYSELCCLTPTSQAYGNQARRLDPKPKSAGRRIATPVVVTASFEWSYG